MNEKDMKEGSGNNERVFVTGGSGFLGRAIVDRLLAGGYRVIALARRANIPQHLKRAGVQLVVGDVREPEAIARGIEEADYVIHAAATKQGSWSYFHQVNVQATETVLREAARRPVKRLVHISSASVYPVGAIRRGQVGFHELVNENEEFATFYAKSKLKAEKLVWKYVQESRLPCVVFRPGAVYGPFGPVFPATLGLALGDRRILLIGDSGSKLALSYVENVADAVVRSLQQDNVVDKCFDLVEDETLTRKEYVRLIKERIDPKLSVVHLPLWFMNLTKLALKNGFRLIGKTAPLSALNLRSYCSTVTYANANFKKAFGAQPHVTFAESIERTVQWHREKRTPKRSHGLKRGKVVIPSKEKLRVGIIGCGKISHVHLSFLSKLDNVDSIVVADPQASATRAVAERFSISGHYADYREMLERERLHVVHVLTPPQWHAPAAMHAAEKGCHVLVEKPMAVDAQQAQQMVQAAQKNHVKMAIVHNHLFDEVMIKAREIVARGLLGRIASLHGWYGVQMRASALPPDPRNHWSYSLPGSFYQNFMPHALYVMTEFMPSCGLRDVVASYAGNIPAIESDELKVTLQNEKALGLLSLSLSVSPRYQFVNVFGTKGSMKIDFLNKVIYLDKEINALPRMINRSLSALKYSAALSFAAMRNSTKLFQSDKFLFEGTERLIRLFYRSILLDEREPVPATEGLELMELMDQMWDKLKPSTHAPVEGEER